MNRLILLSLCISILLGCNSEPKSINTLRSGIEFDISFQAKENNDSIYIGLTKWNFGYEPIPFLDTLLAFPDGKGSIDLSKGFYRIRITSKLAQPIEKIIHVKDTNSRFIVEGNLSIYTGVKPTEIRAIYSANRFRPYNNYEKLIKSDKLYKTPVPTTFKKGDTVLVQLAHGEFYKNALLNSFIYKKRGVFVYKYDPEIINFNNFNYKTPDKDISSEILIKGPDGHEDFERLISTLYPLQKEFYNLWWSDSTKEKKQFFYIKYAKSIKELQRKFPDYTTLLEASKLTVAGFFSKENNDIDLAIKESEEAVLKVIQTTQIRALLKERLNKFKRFDFNSNQYTYSVLNYYDRYLFKLIKLDSTYYSKNELDFFKVKKDDMILNAVNNEAVRSGLISRKIHGFLGNSQPDSAKKYIKLIESFASDDNFYKKNGVINRWNVQLSVLPGAQAPNIKFNTLDGKEVKLSDYKGQYIFIDFWGTWCRPCLEELPHNIALIEANIDNLIVLGLAKDSELKLKNFLSKKPLPYMNAVLSKEAQELFGVTSFPTTYLIDQNGVILSKGLKGENLTELIKKIIH